MYHLNMDLDVRRDVEGAPCVRDYLAGREGDPTPVVDARYVRRNSGYLVPVKRGVSLRGRRPCARIGSCFAGEVPRVELLESGVDVVGVEHDAYRDAVVGIGLDDAERLADELLGPLVFPPQARAAQDQALPASRNDGRRYVRTNFPESSRVRDNDISTWQDSGVHDSPAIVRGNVLGQDFRHRGPIAFGEVHLVVLINSACGVFYARRMWLQFI